LQVEQPDGLARVEQAPGDVDADEAGAAGDQDGAGGIEAGGHEPGDPIPRRTGTFASGRAAPIDRMSDRTGRAAVLSEFGAPLQIRELPVPAPEPGAVLARIDAATVCGSDVHVWKSDLGPSYSIGLPLIPGHEMAGTVVELGEGVDRDAVGEPLRPGDRIVWAYPSCGHCVQCTIEHEPSTCRQRVIAGLQDCTVAPYWLGGFGEYGYVAPRAERLRIPDGVETAWASAASCALRTVVNVVERAGRIDHLDTVVVQGAGPLGLFATALLATLDAGRIVVVGGPDARLEIAREWGATDTVAIDAHPDPDARRDAVLTTLGAGPTVVLELSGAPGTAAEGIGMVRSNGRVVIAGTLGGAPQPIDVARITTGQLRITGSFSGAIDSYWKALRFLDRHQDRFDWDRLLSPPRPLAQATDALAAMVRGDEVKPVVEPGR